MRTSIYIYTQPCVLYIYTCIRKRSQFPYRIVHVDRAHDFLAVRAGEPDREAWIEGPVVVFVGSGGEMA